MERNNLMLGLTKLLCGSDNRGDSLRYTDDVRNASAGVGNNRGPVVVWNCTNTCNLKCRHCYADSKPHLFEGELSSAEAKSLIDDLARFKVPVLLFSGGEPLLRKDLLELIPYAQKAGIRTTLSTNGTLIDKETAKAFKVADVGYVGVSLDGIGEKNDAFRGVAGSFDKALEGIRNCVEVNQRVGLRFTINRHNYNQLSEIFQLIEKENINRVCFYHLVYSGRGSRMIDDDISNEEKKEVMNLIIEKTLEFGKKIELLTVDNHADAPYLYLWIKKNNPKLAEKVWHMLQNNRGNRSGMAFANIDWQGNVHADQFSQKHTFGNIREMKFSELWKNTKHPLAVGLRNRKPLIKGRCSLCRWFSICNGNLRIRAEAITGDFWSSDPACYLSDEEIGLSD